MKFDHATLIAGLPSGLSYALATTFLMAAINVLGGEELVKTVAPTPANLLSNPGFEMMNESGKLDGWSITDSVTVDSAVNHTGKQALRIVAVERDWNKNNVHCAVKGIEPNTEYQVSFFAKVGAGTGHTVLSCFNFGDGEGKLIGGGSVNYAQSREKNFDWRRFSGIVKAPSKTVSTSLHLYMSGNVGTTWYDDVVVCENELRRVAVKLGKEIDGGRIAISGTAPTGVRPEIKVMMPELGQVIQLGDAVLKRQEDHGYHMEFTLTTTTDELVFEYDPRTGMEITRIDIFAPTK